MLIVVLFFVLRGGFSAKIDRALAAGRYFPPAADSVFELFMAEAKSNPNSPEVQAAAAKIVAKLGPEADEQLQSFYRESEMRFSWSQMARYYGFLETLAPADGSLKVKHAYAEGQLLLLDERNYARAFEQFNRALAADSRFVLAINGIAKIYIQESSPFRDEAAAIRWYVQAVDADPNFTWAAKNLGEYYMKQGEWETAESYMLRALRTSPARPSILGALGRISFNRRNYAAAQDYYVRALQGAKNADDIRRYNHSLEQVREKL